jgi:hypothetical protein
MSGLRICAEPSGRPVGLLRGGRQTGGSKRPGPAVLVWPRWPGRFDIRLGAPSSIATGVGTHLRLCNLLFCNPLRCGFEFDCQHNGQRRAPCRQKCHAKLLGVAFLAVTHTLAASCVDKKSATPRFVRLSGARRVCGRIDRLIDCMALPMRTHTRPVP